MGCTPYKWAIVSGALPTGVTAKASSTTTSLNLTGTPTTAATYSFTVKVTCCGGGHFADGLQSCRASEDVRLSCHHDHLTPQWHRRYSIFGGRQGQRRLHPLQVGDCVGSTTRRCHRESVRTTTSLNLPGTPTTAASDSFTVKVTACSGAASQMAYKTVIQSTANHVVDLKWRASTSSDVAGYNLYRSPDGATWKRINVSLIASALYSDSTVANGSTYYYAATAVDISGHQSSMTATIKVVIP
jgi:hypothetical protein